MSDVLTAAADLCGIGVDVAVASGVDAKRLYVRQLAAHLGCRRFGITPAAAARALKRDRKSIVHSLHVFDRLLDSEPAVRADVEAISAAVRERSAVQAVPC